MQVLCPYYVKNHMKAMLHWQMCGCIFQFELNESIIKQLIKHLFHKFLLLFRFNPIETIVAFMRRAIAFLSGPWAHVCDEITKALFRLP